MVKKKSKRKPVKQTYPKINILSKILNPFPGNRSYWILFSLFIAFYIVSYATANANCLTFAMHDDQLYYNLANNLADFNWLGEYNKLTLAKMPGYALFLSFSLITGIPYLLYVGISLAIAVIFFLRKSMWLFQNTKILSFILGILLLFNPVFALEFRIYRLQLPYISFIIFIGVLISMFNPEYTKKNLFIKITDGLTAFLGFGFLFFTREENMLYLALIIITTLLFLTSYKKINNFKQNLFLPLCGISGIILFWVAIASMNYTHYGRFVVCERTSKSSTAAIKAFNSVADNHLNPKYPLSSTSREKIIQVGREVPEFRNLARYLYQGSYGWSSHSLYFDKNDLSYKKINSNDLPTSHFEFFWMDCMDAAGYYKNAASFHEFNKTLTHKINQALDEGRLKKRKVLLTIGPYCIAKSDIKTILRLLPKNYTDLFFKRDQIVNVYSNVLARENVKADEEELDNWAKTLKVNVIKNGDTENTNKAAKSFLNKIWNLFTLIFSVIAVPLIHIAIPITLIAFILALIKKLWLKAALLFIITSSYILFLLMLTILDIITGYDASIIPYYLPAYAAILTGALISVNVIFNLKTKRASQK